MTESIAMRPAVGRSAQFGMRRKILCCGTAMMAVLAASAAHAQCTNPTATINGGGSVGAQSFAASTLPASSVVSGVQSLVSVLTTQNTAFLTQTSGFIGAPANPPAEIQGGGGWVRGIGGTFDTRTPGNYATFPNSTALLGPGQSGTCNIRTFQDYAGFQAGADISRLNINGFNMHGGVTVGYTESTVRSNGTFSADFQTPFIGLYGAITKGGFFADGQIRWDFFQGSLRDSDPGNTLFNQRLDARSLSLTGNIGYQIPLPDGFFVEPSAGAVYAQVKVDSLQSAGGIFLPASTTPSLAFPNTTKVNDFESILARASIRVGKNFTTDSLALQPFFTATVINEFGAPVRTTVSTNLDAYGRGVFNPPITGASVLDQQARLNTYRIGTYGQFSVGIAGQLLNTGWLGYVRGDYRTGDRVEGWGISGGLRYQFNPEAVARPLITKGDAPVIAPLEGPVNWTGFSVGASAGALWSQTRQIVDTGVQLIAPTTALTPVDPHAAGVYAGGQIGADYQFGKFVVGVAGDGGWTNARGGRGCESGIFGNFFNCRTNIDDLYMATARVGYAVDRSLFYVKGGGAFAHTQDSKMNNFGNLVTNFPTEAGGRIPNSLVRDFAAGWTAGAGFEFAITRNISAKAEYMHFELDRRSYARGPFGATNRAIATAEHIGDIVKVGVNYRFIFEPAVVAPAPVIAKY